RVSSPFHSAAVYYVLAAVGDFHRCGCLRRCCGHCVRCVCCRHVVGQCIRIKGQAVRADSQVNQVSVVCGIGSKIHSGCHVRVIAVECHTCTGDDRHTVCPCFSAEYGVVLAKLHVLGLVNPDICTVCPYIQIAISADDIAVRDKFQHIHVSGD